MSHFILEKFSDEQTFIGRINRAKNTVMMGPYAQLSQIGARLWCVRKDLIDES